MNRRVAINLGFFLALFGVMLVWAVNNIITLDIIEKPYIIKAEFAATVGVTGGSEVAYLGVNYGRVQGVESVPGGVVISMSIDRDKHIPANSFARIFRKSAIGEPYIDFTPPDDYPGESGPVIEAGTIIPMERTSVPLEFSELLRSASALIGEVDAEYTETLIHELAVTLQGRSDDLRALTTAGDALVQTFAERTDLLDRLSTNNTRLTRTITEHRRSLSSAIADLTDLSDSLRRAEGDTNVLLDRGTQLLGELADLVADVKLDVDCVLHDLDDVITLAASEPQRANLKYLLDNAPTGLGYLFLTRDEQPGDQLWVRVNLLLDPEHPAEQYVPRTELPAVPTVPACVSSLPAISASDAFRFNPSVLDGSPVTAGASLPATGGPVRSLLALLFVFAGAVTWQARRSTRRGTETTSA